MKGEEKEKDKYRDIKEKKAMASSSCSAGGDAVPQEPDVFDATISDVEAEDVRPDTLEEIDPPIARLIKKITTAVGRECEVRWVRKMARMTGGRQMPSFRAWKRGCGQGSKRIARRPRERLQQRQAHETPTGSPRR